MNRYSLVRLIISLAILLCCGTFNGHSQNAQNLIQLVKTNKHHLQRSPSNEKIVLPSVYYDPIAELLIFSSETALASLPVEVLDEAENVWMQETLTVESGRTSAISVSSLPAGTYTVRIWIKGLAYIGVFEVE